jgi:hypothetical protein
VEAAATRAHRRLVISTAVGGARTQADHTLAPTKSFRRRPRAASNTYGVSHPACSAIITASRRAGRLGPLSLFHLFEQLLAPDPRDPTRAVAFVAKPLASRKPAGHPAAALADWALVIGLLSIRDHAPEYKAKMLRREAGNGWYFLAFC